MNSSRMRTGASPARGGKRRKSRASGARARKKQKKLDAICDRAPTAPVDTAPNDALHEGNRVESDDPALLRRSSRVRKAPIILDSSPVPSHRKNPNLGRRTSPIRGSGNGKKTRKRKKGGLDSKVKKEITFQEEVGDPAPGDGASDEEEDGDWGSRLRSRVRKGRGGASLSVGKRSLSSGQSDGQLGEDKGPSEPRSLDKDGLDRPASEWRRRRGRKKKKRKKRKSKDEDQALTFLKDDKEEGVCYKDSNEEEMAVLLSTGKECGGKNASLEEGSKIEAQKGMPEQESRVTVRKSSIEEENKTAMEIALPEEESKVAVEKYESKVATEKDESKVVAEGASLEEESKDAFTLLADQECERQEDLETTEEIREKREEGKCVDISGGSSIHLIGEDMVLPAHNLENGCFRNNQDIHMEELNNKASESQDILKLGNVRQVLSVDASDSLRVREGRRCGLCGGGSDGKPPKKLVPESTDSDNEAYNGSPSSEEPNYNVWDGFGDEPEWLGRLLGPIHDRFGIARVWVHQHCAVWSPEVYFAGLGCLKNVRAALYRGRALKCSRCGRPGATIGCRVDRCPKTYHLPCARTDGCIFDHRKFLIACTDHRQLFQPQGNQYLLHIKRMKAKKMKLDLRKLSNDTSRKDLEAEEKWLENCGEDEEFLKREGKRLHRDISRIAPVYIGGSSSENGNQYQGWETVAGLQDVIQCMKEVVILPLLYPEFFNSIGLTPPRGVLLHGYPGTGKTLVVRALIGACSRGDKRIAYFARKGADCLGKYVGDAERQLRLLFQVAERCQPSIIFFDEIDGLAPCRSRQQDQTHSSVVSTLLSLLDGLKSRGSVIVIGATNRPEAVDPALRRPGRFDREIYFPLPSVKDRSAILSLHTQSWPKPVSGPLLSWIAEQTPGYAGADLQALCTQAAMIALKRNCPLHEFLFSLEKGSNKGTRPSLPSFVVEEKDWLAALARAPPPCSRREAGMAANDVVTSPLLSHLVPCLLQPLSYLLISFYLDERIWLPPALFKASKSIKDVISSALLQKKMPFFSWKSHLHYLIQEPDVAMEIERNLAHSGLSISPDSVPSCTTDGDDDYDAGYDKFDSHRLTSPGGCSRNNTMRNLSLRWGKSSGFRALVAGIPRSGQQHLAACLLQGFVGHIEIQKVNLATISQEGRGDTICGITQILLKCLSMGHCVVYMPRLELWAVDEMHRQDIEESNLCQVTCEASLIGGPHDATKISSQAWNSFVEQVDSLCRSASLIILATCEVANHYLPLEIRQFFTSHVSSSTDSASSEHTIPRFFVQVDGKFNHELVFDTSAARISQDLVQQYVQLIQHRSHAGNACEELKVCPSMMANSETKNLTVCNKETIEVMDTSVNSERITSNNGASCRDDQNQVHTNGNKQHSPTSKLTGDQEVDVPLQCHQDSLSRIPLNNKMMKGNSVLTIATLGYQILRYPHFAELCWATSKLKEGPCTDINGPWKGWPFNSCVIHDNSSAEKAACILNTSNAKDREHSCVVRGLIAVGLLAYRGYYTSSREVSYEIRKVLELLVVQLSAKIHSGKDQYRFLRLLSQVAYIEDMVNCWAYTFRSFSSIIGDSQITTSSNRPSTVRGLNADNHANDSKLHMTGSSMPNLSNKICNELQVDVQETIALSLTAENGKHVSQLSTVIPEPEDPDEMLSSVPLPPVVNPEPDNPLLDSGGPCRSDSPAPYFSPSERQEPMKTSTSLSMTDATHCLEANFHGLQKPAFINCSSGEVNDQCNGLDTVHASDPCGFMSDEQIRDAESNLRRNTNNNKPAICETFCLYHCCSDCLRALHGLTREILTDYWESSGRCSTVDDVHDVVASCSLNLLAAIRKGYFSQGGTIVENCYSRKQSGIQAEHFFCQDVGHIKLKEVSLCHKTSKSIEFLPTECCCHTSDSVGAMKDTLEDSPLWPASKFFFRDNTLVPSNTPKGIVFHCKFENLCICSIIEMILMIKQPSI